MSRTHGHKFFSKQAHIGDGRGVTFPPVTSVSGETSTAALPIPTDCTGNLVTLLRVTG